MSVMPLFIRLLLFAAGSVLLPQNCKENWQEIITAGWQRGKGALTHGSTGQQLDVRKEGWSLGLQKKESKQNMHLED